MQGSGAILRPVRRRRQQDRQRVAQGALLLCRHRPAHQRWKFAPIWISG